MRTPTISAILWLAACSSSPADGPDASTASDAAVDAVADIAARPAPEAPDIPWLAAGRPPLEPPVDITWTCASGWVPREADGVTTCEPYAAGGPESCDREDEAHFPGTPGCARFDRVCSDADWPCDLPQEGVAFVRIGAAAPGAGTRASPFPTIDAALAGTASVIALAPGVYEGGVTISRAVTIRGSGVAATRLTRPSGATLTVEGARARLEDVHVEGRGAGLVIVHEPGTELHLEGVLVTGTRKHSIRVEDGATLSAKNLVVTAPDASSTVTEQGGLVAVDATVRLERVIFEGCRGVGIEAIGTELELRDSVVRGTVGLDETTDGRGVSIVLGAEATLERVLLEANTASGIFIGESGPNAVVLHDVIVRDTREEPGARKFGVGILAQDDDTISASQVLIEQSHEYGVRLIAASLDATALVVRDTAQQGVRMGTGVALSESGDLTIRRGAFFRNHSRGVTVEAGTFELEDLVVRETQSSNEGEEGRGLNFSAGARGKVTRASITGNHDIGVFASRGATKVELRHVRIEDTGPLPDGTSGRGIEVQSGATVEAFDAVVRAHHYLAIVAVGEGTTLRLEDIVVEDTVGQQSDGVFGRAITAEEGSVVTVDRALLARNHDAALDAGGEGARLTARDVIVRDTESRASDGIRGRGAQVEAGATMELTRVVIEGAHQVGIYAADAKLTATGLVIREVEPSACGASCPTHTGGTGLGCYGADVEVRDFLIEDIDLCGIQLADGCGMDLWSGVVRRCAIGVCLQMPNYDLSRLFGDDDVDFSENDVAIDPNAAFAVPPPSESPFPSPE